MTKILHPGLISSEIPDRLSAVDDHPDFHPVWSRAVLQVYLDGVPVKDVMRFDTKEGWVEFHERDAKGEKIVYDGPSGKYLGTRRQDGRVSVKFRDPGAIH